ncbi:hypothetical protein CEUSTIGMA_g12526.t1 [Chlamydomonas eustigma]|uniref:Uncharacterized protein n=1 Tax=Chlamydomonas eustigma TaxID=1157962 RepID=A0A250XPY9_9CHLO|nr:hypothetical protein CEUSTIGMA_g12526.t1 [Chlamydomonas eustigma]|eukprot:GAX85106.1 hypothetical protein CEUSTIGMA_g12526.t1 [Chlamydomonas eustigma]
MDSRRSDQDDVVAMQSAPAVAAEGSAASTALSGWREAWEGKGSLLLHMDFVSDIVVHTLTLAPYMHVWFLLHGLTFQALIDAILFLDIHSIMVSMFKRTRGIGTVAGISHLTDQEVDSPYKRLNVGALRGSRGSERTPPAASPGRLAAPIPRGSPQEGQQVTVDRLDDKSQLPTREDDIKFENQVGPRDTEGMRGGSAMLSRRTSIMRLRTTLN